MEGLGNVDRVLLVVRADHVAKYKFIDGLRYQFNGQLDVCILDERTSGPAETVYRAILHKKINGPIAIKDCDNYFECNVPNCNFVAFSTLTEQTNALNKSYVLLDGDRIVNIKDREILSRDFCCGLYCFENSQEFVDVFEKNNYPNVCGIVEAIGGFKSIKVMNYYDWGTREDWTKYCETFKTIFIDLDGVIVKNSSQFMKPKWGETELIQKNVDYLKRQTNATIIITTCRTEEYKEVTERQLEGVPYHRIIFGLPHSKRFLVNDYAGSNPYPSAYAVNIQRDSDKLEEFM